MRVSEGKGMGRRARGWGKEERASGSGSSHLGASLRSIQLLPCMHRGRGEATSLAQLLGFRFLQHRVHLRQCRGAATSTGFSRCLLCGRDGPSGSSLGCVCSIQVWMCLGLTGVQRNQVSCASSSSSSLAAVAAGRGDVPCVPVHAAPAERSPL